MPTMSENNLMAFRAKLAGPGVNANNDQALYMHWFGGLNMLNSVACAYAEKSPMLEGPQIKGPLHACEYSKRQVDLYAVRMPCGDVPLRSRN